MTKKIAAGMKGFKEAQEMVRRTDKSIAALEKSLVKEEVKSSLTLQEKRMFSRMGADNEVAMMLFQDLLFAGLGTTLFTDNMLDMLGVTQTEVAALGTAAQVAQEVVVESYEDRRQEYLAQQKEEMLRKQREYDAEEQRRYGLGRKNDAIRTWMFFMMVVMAASLQQWILENTMQAYNDNDNEPENDNVVSLFNENKLVSRKAEPRVQSNTPKGFKLALGL